MLPSLNLVPWKNVLDQENKPACKPAWTTGKRRPLLEHQFSDINRGSHPEAGIEMSYEDPMLCGTDLWWHQFSQSGCYANRFRKAVGVDWSFQKNQDIYREKIVFRREESSPCWDWFRWNSVWGGQNLSSSTFLLEKLSFGARIETCPKISKCSKLWQYSPFRFVRTNLDSNTEGDVHFIRSGNSRKSLLFFSFRFLITWWAS